MFPEKHPNSTLNPKYVSPFERTHCSNNYCHNQCFFLNTTEPVRVMAVKCDECWYTAPINYAVKIHKLRVHSGLKPWKCEYPGCSYKCKEKSALKRHQIIHETVPELKKPFRCPIDSCAYRATQKVSLKPHLMAQHTPKRTRDFQGQMCPLRFFTKSTLTLHIPCHAREKVLQCSHCDYVAYSRAGLYNHVKQNHEKGVVFTFPVPGCTYRTKWKDSLPKHQKTHDPGRPICSVADFPTVLLALHCS